MYRKKILQQLLALCSQYMHHLYNNIKQTLRAYFLNLLNLDPPLAPASPPSVAPPPKAGACVSVTVMWSNIRVDSKKKRLTPYTSAADIFCNCRRFRRVILQSVDAHLDFVHHLPLNHFVGHTLQPHHHAYSITSIAR